MLSGLHSLFLLSVAFYFQKKQEKKLLSILDNIRGNRQKTVILGKSPVSKNPAGAESSSASKTPRKAFGDSPIPSSRVTPISENASTCIDFDPGEMTPSTVPATPGTAVGLTPRGKNNHPLQ